MILYWLNVLVIMLHKVSLQQITLPITKVKHNRQSSSATKSVLSIIEEYDNQLISNVCFGNPNQCLNMTLTTRFYLPMIQLKSPNTNINANTCYIPDDSLTYTDILPIKETQVFYNKQLNTGIYAKDTIRLDNTFKGKDFSFLLLTDPSSSSLSLDNSQGVLGFDYTDDSIQSKTDFSFIDQLYQQSLISTKKFTLDYNTPNHTPSKLIIGDLPEYLTDNSDKFIYFSIFKSPHQKWSLNATKIITGKAATEKSIMNETRISFSFDSAFILAPRSFKNFIVNRYLDEQFSLGKCKIQSDIDSTLFFCNNDVLYSSMPVLKVIIGTYQFNLEPRDLFIEHNATMKLFAVYIRNRGSDVNEDWIFGEPFMKTYQVIFNKDQGSIGFYSVNGLIKVSLQESNYIIILIVFCSLFVVCAGVFVYCYVSVKKEKSEPVFNDFRMPLEQNENDETYNN